MDKVYGRINWDTETCNGSMNTNKYLFSQLARAICLASYEKPLTVEEISICTGIPTMYIEDELPRLAYGDAICKVGNKYVTNFIIFRHFPHFGQSRIRRHFFPCENGISRKSDIFLWFFGKI